MRFLLSFLAVIWPCNSIAAQTEMNYFLPSYAKKAYTVYCPAFDYGLRMPDKYTCKGQGVSPGILWKNPPKGTKSFVLIVDDADVPAKYKIWYHWILFDIPADARQLPEGIENLPEGTKKGKNSWNNLDYGGPCPPPGKRHQYYFTLSALDIPTLDLSEGATAKEIYKKIEGHVLAEDNWMGTYSVEEKI